MYLDLKLGKSKIPILFLKYDINLLLDKNFSSCDN